MDAREVKIALHNQAESVCTHLLPSGKRKRHEWWVGGVDGSDGESLKIVISGSKVGVWKDFSSDEAGSNLLELWRQVGNVTFVEALNEAREYLGVKEDEDFVKYRQSRNYEKPKLPDTCPPAEQMDKGKAFFDGRGITSTTVSKFKVLTTETGGKREICFQYLNGDGLEMLKYLEIDRVNGKKIIRTSANSKKGLYGKHLVTDNQSEVIITEGELDAMSYVQAGHSAVSVPFGAKWESDTTGKDPNMEWVTNDWDFLERFDEIYISMDMDEAGELATGSIVKRLGRERCRIIALPLKDANEVLTQLGRDALTEAVESAKTLEPEHLKNVLGYSELLHEKFFSPQSEQRRGIPTPWGIPWNIRLNELSIVTGFSGSGKTMLLNYLCCHLAQMGKKICIASLEVRVDETIACLVSQVVAQDDPNDGAHLDEALDWLSNAFWFYDHVGQVDFESMVDSFVYAHRRYGVCVFVIDSLMKCGLSFDDYAGQKVLVDKLAEFVNKYDIHVFLVAHARKKESEQERVGKMDVKGITEITDMAHNVVSVWRNKGKEETVFSLTRSERAEDRVKGREMEYQIHDSIFSVDKQRGDRGEEPTIKLFYDKDSRHYTLKHGDIRPFCGVVEETEKQKQQTTKTEPERESYFG